MAYNFAFMSCLGPTSGAMLWSYQTTDTRAQVLVSGYFNSIAPQLDVGDRIHCLANGVAFDAAVATNSGGVVTTVASLSYA